MERHLKITSKTSSCTSDGPGNNAKHSQGISFLKLSGNPESVSCWRLFSDNF